MHYVRNFGGFKLEMKGRYIGRVEIGYLGQRMKGRYTMEVWVSGLEIVQSCHASQARLEDVA